MADATAGGRPAWSVHGLFVLPDLTEPAPPSPEGAGPLDAQAADVPPEAPGSRVARVRRASTLSLRAVYLDSPDLRLAREGVTLCHTSGDGEPGWVLTLSPSGRSGASAIGSGAQVSRPGPPTPVPPALHELVTAWLRAAPLTPVASLRTERAVTSLLDPAGDEVGQLVDDTVSVLEGRRVVSRFRELALDADGLQPPARERLAAALTAAGAVAGEPLPAVTRALGPRAVAPGDLPAATPVGPEDPAAAAVALSLRTNTRRLLLADVGVRRAEPDAVHQMRVACRRMRSDLATFGPLVQQEWARGLREELAWLAGSLGVARDLEVLRERIRDVAAERRELALDPVGVRRVDELLACDERGGLDEAGAALRSRRYVALLDALVVAAQVPVTTGLAEQPCSQALPPLVASAWADLARPADGLKPRGRDAGWHRARIRAKRARYAAEAVAPALGKPALRAAAAATAVQEVLGAHQDAAVAAETLDALARRHLDDGLLCLTLGRLVEGERHRVATARTVFPAVWRDARELARASRLLTPAAGRR